MTTALAHLQPVGAELFDKLVLQQDLSSLSQTELVQYYTHVCQYAGLDPMTKPFDVMVFQGKKVLYANKTCTAQLTAKHRPSVRIVDRSMSGGLCIVTAEVTKQDGSSVQDVGVVAMPQNGSTEAGANAIMKATTKAKRRALLSAFGLGMLDETEADEMFGAVREDIPIEQPAPVDTIVLDTIAALESCDDPEVFKAIAAKIKTFSQEHRNQLGNLAVQTADKLGLVYSKGQWVAKVTSPAGAV